MHGDGGGERRRRTSVTSSVHSCWLPSDNFRTPQRVGLKCMESDGMVAWRLYIVRADYSPQRCAAGRHAHCTRRLVNRVVPRLRHSPKHCISPSGTAASRIVLYHSDRECRMIHHMTYVANSATGRHLCCPIRSDHATPLSMTHSFGIRFRHTNSNTNTMSKDTYSLVCQGINRVRKCF